MDSTIAREAQGSTPYSIQEIVALGQQLGSRLLCCSLNSGLKSPCELLDIHYAVALNTSALGELQKLLALDAHKEAHETTLLKDEGKRSIMDLVDALYRAYRALTLVLLKASTEDPDKADFGVIDKLDLMQELTERRLAAVVRDGWISWINPRVELCAEKLRSIGLDLMLHVYVLKLAQHQLSPPQNRAGSFDEELALRAFAERWLSLWEKSVKTALEDRQKRFRLRNIINDNVSECDDEIIEIDSPDVNDNTDDSEQKSETASECSTIVDVVVSSVPEKEGNVKKTEESSQNNSPSSVAQSSKTNEQPQTAVSKSDKAPRGLKRLVPSLSLRIKSFFSNDAPMLKRLGYHEANPQLEAWVTGPNPNTILVKLPLSHDQVLQELKKEVRKGIKPSWDNALAATQQERDAIEDTRARATLADHRTRTCVYVSERRSDLGTNVFELPGFRRIIYLAIGEKLDVIFVTDPDGHELCIPLSQHRFWGNIATAYMINEKPKAPFYRHLVQTSRYDLVAEDGRNFFANGPTGFAKPGDRFTMVTRGPHRPPGHFTGMPPPPPVARIYVPSISSVASSVDDAPTWEMEQELGFGDEEPVESSDDEEEEEKKVKLSDLVARLTNAPDTNFDAEVAEGVLGAMDSDSDDDSDCSRSTVD